MSMGGTTKTKMLRDSVNHALHDAAGIPVYYRFAPPIAKPPYVVFSMSIVSSGDNFEWYDMAAEIADYGHDDESAIEGISDRVGKTLDYFVSTGDNVSWFCYLLNTRVVDSQDKNILRLRLNFEIRVIDTIAR